MCVYVLGKLVSSCKHAKFIRYMNENTNESVIKRTHFYSFCVYVGQLRLGSGFFVLFLASLVSLCRSRILYTEKQKTNKYRTLSTVLHIHTHTDTHTLRDRLCIQSCVCVCVVEVCRNFVSVELTHCIREI